MLILIITIIISQKKDEGDREDANRPHGHLVEQPANVRQKNIIIFFSSLNHDVFCYLKNCKIYRFIS